MEFLLLALLVVFAPFIVVLAIRFFVHLLVLALIVVGIIVLMIFISFDLHLPPFWS